MKVIVIGCTHAGTAAILNTSKLYPQADITLYERNETISFLSCGIALYVGGIVKDPQELFYCSPQKLAEFGVQTKMSHDVLDVNLMEQKIKVRNLKNGEEFEDTFDKLLITTGSWPVIPKIEGIELENILLAKNFDHSNAIVEKLKTSQNIVVIGAGYIGVELAEAFGMNGKSVTLIDAKEKILSKYLDKEFIDLAEDALRRQNIRLALGENIIRFEGQNGVVKKVVTTKNTYEADLVILCIGFKPNTHIFSGQVEMLDNGAIIVDEFMRTSNKNVFAAGDSCAVRFNPTGKHEYIPLATNAVRMGTLAARNLLEPKISYMGTQATSGIKICDYNIASTGLTKESANLCGLDVSSSMIDDFYRPEFMPTNAKVKLKVVFEKSSRRILGAQFLSEADLTQSINTLSVCIQNNMTIDDLAFVDFFFQPHFNKPWNFLNLVGLKAEI